MSAAAAVFILSWLFKKAALDILPSPALKLAAVCVSAVFKYCMTVPIFFGFSRLICLSASGKDINGGAFYYFEKAGRYFKLLAINTLTVIKTAFIFLIPTALTAGGIFVCTYFDLFDIYTLFLLFLIMVSVVITLQLSIYMSARYFLCAYIFIQCEELSIRKIFRFSAKKMSDKKSEIFTVFYSMFGLYIICILLLPIIFVLPYTVAVFAVYGTMYLKQLEIKAVKTDTITFNTGEKA